MNTTTTKTVDKMTETERTAEYKKFLDAKFSGLEPEDIIFMMALPEPDAAAASSVTVGPKSPDANKPISGELGYCYEFKSGKESNACKPTEADFIPPKEFMEAKETGL